MEVLPDGTIRIVITETHCSGDAKRKARRTETPRLQTVRLMKCRSPACRSCTATSADMARSHITSSCHRVIPAGASASTDNIAANNSWPRTMPRCAARVTPAPLIAKDGKGSVGWLINLYRHSRDWGELLSAGTRKQRGPILKQIEIAAGDLPISAITRTKVEQGISARTPNQGRHFKNTMARPVQMGR